MVQRASIISESEVSITVLLSAMLTLLHTAVRIKKLFKKYLYNHYEKYGHCLTPQLSSETEVSIALLYQLCSTHYTVVRIKNCLKSTSVIKVATMKNTDNFCYTKSSCATTKSTLFTVSKDECSTKEDPGSP